MKLNERVPTLDKKAEDLAQSAHADLCKALPEKEKTKGLQLFDIMNQSMKRTRRVNSGENVKPLQKLKIKTSRRKLKL